MEVFIGQFINGVSLASIFLLIALGLNITFGMMGVINFAHGEFLMLGAYSVFLVQAVVPQELRGIMYFVSIPAAFAVSGGLGFLLERILIRRLYGNPFGGILATWGVSLILMQGARTIFGANNVDVKAPDVLQGGIALGNGVQIPITRLFIFLLVVAVLAGMYFYMYRSAPGRRMQAVMQNRAMAGCMGINTARVDSLTFMLGSGLAGVAGACVTLLGSIGPATGQNYIVDSFLVVVLGGVGSLGGTVAGSVMMGFASPYLEWFTNSSMGKVILFALIIVFLHYRPEGLIPRKTRALES